MILRRLGLKLAICHREHILDENAVAYRGVVYHNVGDRADELAVLNDGRTAHECVQVGTTHFYNFLTVLTPFVKKIVLCGSILAYILTHTNIKNQRMWTASHNESIKTSKSIYLS